MDRIQRVTHEVEKGKNCYEIELDNLSGSDVLCRKTERALSLWKLGRLECNQLSPIMMDTELCI
jgi:hypothetical protein